MTRRSLGKMAVLGVPGGLALPAFAQTATKPQAIPEVTNYVADFVSKTGFADLPGEVVDLAKKSILDGLGLAICGSVANSGEIVRIIWSRKACWRAALMRRPSSVPI